MTLQSSGTMTGQNIRDELRQSGGNLVFPDATTRWLADKPSGNLVLPNDYYSKQAVKNLGRTSIGSGQVFSNNINFGPDFPGRSTIIIAIGVTTTPNTDVGVNSFKANGVTIEQLDSRIGWNGSMSWTIAVGCTPATGTAPLIDCLFGFAVDAAYYAVLTISNRGTPGTVSNNGFAGTGTSASTTANVPVNNGFFLINGLKHNIPGVGMDITGATEVFDTDLAVNTRWGLAISNRLPTQTGRTGSINFNGSSDLYLGSVVGFG